MSIQALFCSCVRKAISVTFLESVCLYECYFSFMLFSALHYWLAPPIKYLKCLIVSFTRSFWVEYILMNRDGNIRIQ